MKNIIILGSTGSIGTQAVDVIKKNREDFNVVGLAAHKNASLLIQQAKELGPKYVCLIDEEACAASKAKFRDYIFLEGTKGVLELAKEESSELVLNAIVGSAGLPATIAAIEANKILALANKESLVAGGDLVNDLLTRSKTKIIPVDSEHSAIFQCLIGEDPKEVKKIILTASGGPFRGRKPGSLGDVTPNDAISHPRWNMGKKISVDSATLMNKGLEVIEAHFLFGVPYDKIEIVIHPESIIHSMVEFVDGSIKAHLGRTDMRIPIQYALTYPKRLSSPVDSISFKEIATLTFEEVDFESAPCIGLALRAAEKGRSHPAVMNAANEVSVEAFLNEEISFTDIGEIIEATLIAHRPFDIEDFDDFIRADAWARKKANDLIKSRSGLKEKLFGGNL